MKQAISVTLDADNLAWLRGRARAGARSVSETLDRLVATARGGGAGTESRSVVGTVSIDADDPELATADAAVRALLLGSLERARAGRRGATRSRGRTGG